MPYRLDIPGQVSEHQLKAIEAVASLVPAGGTIVEVGSLFGRSSWAWAKSVPSDVQVHCIDPWEGNEGIRNMEAQHGIRYGLEHFQEFTADCPNIIARQGYSPRDFMEWEGEIDLYYEDAVHTDPIFSQNLSLWSSRLKASGIACGDDYRPRFEDIISGVARQAEEMERELITVDFFWCLLPHESQVAGVNEVAEELRRLSESCQAEHRGRGVAINVGPVQPIKELKTTGAEPLRVRVYNAGLDPWPIQGGQPVVGIRVYDSSGQFLRSAEVMINAKNLQFDIPHDVNVTVPIDGLPPGEYNLAYDIGDGTEWLLGEKSRLHAFSILN